MARIPPQSVWNEGAGAKPPTKGATRAAIRPRANGCQQYSWRARSTLYACAIKVASAKTPLLAAMYTSAPAPCLSRMAQPAGAITPLPNMWVRRTRLPASAPWRGEAEVVGDTSLCVPARPAGSQGHLISPQAADSQVSPVARAIASYQFDFPTCLSPLKESFSNKAAIALKDPAVTQSDAYFNLGAFGFEDGRRCGVFQRTEQFSEIARFLNAFLRLQFPSASWTSVCVSHNVRTQLHTDAGNEVDSLNHSISLGNFAGGEIWITPALRSSATLIPPPEGSGSGNQSMIFAMSSISLLGSLVWGHHMYTVGLESDTRAYFTGVTILISLPTGTKIFNWLFTYLGNPPLLHLRISSVFFSHLFLLMFTIGGSTGIMRCTKLEQRHWASRWTLLSLGFPSHVPVYTARLHGMATDGCLQLTLASVRPRFLLMLGRIYALWDFRCQETSHPVWHLSLPPPRLPHPSAQDSSWISAAGPPLRFLWPWAKPAYNTFV